MSRIRKQHLRKIQELKKLGAFAFTFLNTFNIADLLLTHSQ